MALISTKGGFNGGNMKMRRWVDLDKLLISINAVFDSKTAKKVCKYLDSYIAVHEELSLWIPVQEHLPDKPGDYWVAMRHLDGSVTTEKMFWCPGWPHEDAWNEVVVAWQPYYCPKPFVPRN